MTRLAKLSWQCRRGTQELDRLLLNYLNTSYITANYEEQQLFEQLLKHEDNELLTFLIVQQCPKNSKFVKLITKICCTTIIHD